MVDRVPAATAGAQVIADACTAEKPELRYPASAQEPSDAMASITDGEYLDLCAGADPIPILGRHGIALSFWPVRPT
jgi:hypothetical protein